MLVRESTIARLGFVALALTLWKSAGSFIFDGLLPRYPEAVALLVLASIAGFASLLVAASSSDAAKYARWSLVGLMIVWSIFAFRDGVRKAATPFLLTNDGHVFMDTAARYFLHGKNPFAESLAEGFRVYRMPQLHATPLLDGDFSDRQAYPALSFLVLVPAVLAHVPTHFVYAATMFAAVALVVLESPSWARPAVVAILTLDETYPFLGFAGVTDTVWVLLVLGAMACWKRRPTAASALVGLACAYKQHPWFLLPLLLVRLGYDHREPVWGPAARRFVMTIGGVFVAVNLPFVVWNPKAWILGVTEPLVAPMVQLSDGLTAMSMTGFIPLSRAGTSIAFWSVYALAVFTYARHTRVLRDWCWVVPGVVLWFGYRALASYWYFFALMAIVALFASTEEEAPNSGRDRSWRITGIAAAVVALGIVAFIVRSATKSAPFDVTIAGTTEVVGLRAVKLRVRVENRLPRTVMPHFSVQSTGWQPLVWVIDSGPRELVPGGAAEYVVRSPSVHAEFDVTEGARLEVRDRTEPGERAFLSVPAERTLKLPDAIPNPEFRVVDSSTQLPSGWSFESTDAAPELSNRFDEPSRAKFTFAESRESTHRARLATELPLGDGTFTLDVNVPSEANRPPFDRLYGVSLRVGDFRVFVLFGDDVIDGVFPSGEHFTSIAAPRGTWATVTIEPRAILERFHAPLAMTRYRYPRTIQLDFPSTPVEVALIATAPPGSFVEFGKFRQTNLRPYEDLANRPSPAGLAAWHGELDLENGNYAKAAKQLELAVRLEPLPERIVRLGDAYFLGGQYAPARDTFTKVLVGPKMAEAEQGLGYALLELGDLTGAVEHLELSREACAAIEKTKPRNRWLNATRGLVEAHVRQKDCARAKELRDDFVAEAPNASPPGTRDCR